MRFCEKLREKRLGANMTQEELSKLLGKSKRTVEGYESGAYYPRTRDVYARLSEIFSTDINWFLTEDETPAQDAAEKAKQLIENARALYAGGELNEDDKDALARALMDAYFIAKKKQEQKRRKGE